ncbi:MAG: ABC transporter permease [Deltaproteobacteria bacterium]|nr:ABC transporter permease [Deltaproteobacteria bacterium]
MAFLSPAKLWSDSAATIRILYNHRKLALELAKRDLTDRYAGQFLGILWVFVHPIILICIFLFVFAYVFNMKTQGTTLTTPLGYSIYLLSGLLPWMSIQEGLGRSPVSILSNASLVKQVIFPLETLPVKVILSTLPSQIVTISALLLYTLIDSKFISWTYLLLPFLIIGQIFLVTGVGLILSAIGVFFRDLKDFIQVALTVGMYTTPIFYFPESVPKQVKLILYLNPFTYVIQCFQDVCYYGEIAHPRAWGVSIGLTLISFIFGCRVFQRLKVYFGSYL